MNSEKAKEALEAIDKAHEMVCCLCLPKGDSGAREWVMSIPARPDYDPDLVIGSALRKAKTILAALNDDGRDDGEKCGACGQRYRAIYRVPNYVWQLIAPRKETLGEHPEHAYGGLLCVECAWRAAEAQGVRLYFEGVTGSWWPPEE